MRKSVFVLALLLVACGSDEQAQDQTAEPTAAANAPRCDDRTPEAPPSEESPGTEKPEIEVPDGDPPCDLIVQDIYEGTGAEAGEGATVTAHYTGVSWSTGEEFDSSWGGEPVTFALTEVIKGWQEGVPGMKEKGRRRLVIPPDLAYGPQGRPGIAPNETLIFVIDLVEVR